MSKETFFRAMNRGQYSESEGLEGSSYCIFTAPVDLHVTHDNLRIEGENMILELVYGFHWAPGVLRLRQVGSNVVLEESPTGQFQQFLADKQVKYLGQLVMYALQFKIQDLSACIQRCTGEMKQLEDQLDNCLDNSGTYQLLDFRRSYTECGNMVIAVKEILAHIDKGYYPMQMQNSYVLQGQVMLEFQFVEERYELAKNTIIKDFDTYTSIINNNINRSARLLSIISLTAVTLNFLFGSLLAVNPVLGIVGGVVVGGLAVGASFMYRINRRVEKPLEAGDRRFSIPFRRRKRLTPAHSVEMVVGKEQSSNS